MTATQLGVVHRQHTEYIPTITTALSPNAQALLERYRQVRAATEAMARPLATEDYIIQTMPDVSPTKWHLAHTSWFFEQFLLMDGPTADPSYKVFHDRYSYLFNSYYVTVGDRHCRIKRGLLSRPTVADVYAYRAHVDSHMTQLIAGSTDTQLERIAPLVDIGLNHEQQHQELAYTDIKHVFSCNPLYPAYREASDMAVGGDVPAMNFLPFDEGVYEVGSDCKSFSYDNESPRHKVYIHPFELADRLITNGEWLEFIEAGGYETPQLWLSEGWAQGQSDRVNWSQPLYWQKDSDGGWSEFTLRGLMPLDRSAPVTHVSYYEADAFARWKGCRLPTEFEWEVAADGHCKSFATNNLQESRIFHPTPLQAGEGKLSQMIGDVWEWTGSQYTPYPGYRVPHGALGEYNGKFMCNQFVLRGGSCVTPSSHLRTTYRNFFPPDARWQFSGLRLARDGAISD